MIAVDGSALIAILRREPEADSFLQVIATADGCLLSSVSLLETNLVLAGRSGDAAAWSELDALIARASMQVVAQDAGLAEAAREAFLRYGKGRHPAALRPPSTWATAPPTPSPKRTACRCCSRAAASQEPT